MKGILRNRKLHPENSIEGWQVIVYLASRAEAAQTYLIFLVLLPVVLCQLSEKTLLTRTFNGICGHCCCCSFDVRYCRFWSEIMRLGVEETLLLF